MSVSHKGTGAAAHGQGNGSEQIINQATARSELSVQPSTGSDEESRAATELSDLVRIAHDLCAEDEAGVLTPPEGMTADAPRRAAIAYAARGWRVVPAKHGFKYPSMKKWQDEATATDWDKILDWFPEGQQMNVCIVTGKESNLFVLDIDDAPAWRGKPAKEGSKTLAELEVELGNLPRTFTVQTRTGGIHMYFSMEGVDWDIRNAVGVSGPLGKDLDIRGNGGQVVAAPSRAREDDNGAAGHYTVADDVPVAAMPQAWLDRLRPKPKLKRVPPRAQSPADSFMQLDSLRFSRPAYTQHDATPATSYGYNALQSACKNIREAPDGTQNHTINKEAHGMGGLFLSGQLGSDAEWVKERLLQAALEGNHPRHRAVRTIESGWNAATPRAVPQRTPIRFRRK
ncbi:bifunctional DNA primase/polymerase [Streptomyces sp. NPDC050546]|uniref:bifunctional DNA primase/polymerase n=1 Tax=Streptomyces sp. NPDC050546 TaxID=3365628 RepID=UPI0037B9E085